MDSTNTSASEELKAEASRYNSTPASCSEASDITKSEGTDEGGDFYSVALSSTAASQQKSSSSNTSIIDSTMSNTGINSQSTMSGINSNVSGDANASHPKPVQPKAQSKKNKWKDRVSAKKQKRNGTNNLNATNNSSGDDTGTGSSEPPSSNENPTVGAVVPDPSKLVVAVRGQSFPGAPTQEDTPPTSGAVIEGKTAVREGDLIVNTLSDLSGTERGKEEHPADLAAEAEDIISRFSESKASSSQSESESASEAGDDSVESNPPMPIPEEPREFALGLGGSDDSMEDDTTTDSSDGVLMHAMSDDDGDIGLEELFQTAAALDVTLETESSARCSRSDQELYEGDPEETDHSVESDSTISCSTIEEERTENLEEETTTDEGSSPFNSSALKPATRTAFAAAVESLPPAPKPKATNRVRITDPAKTKIRTTIVADTIEAEEPSKFSRTRNLLYDSDEETDDYLGSAAPMPWFDPVPYSTGKRKTVDDGVSVTSDDIYPGIQKPVFARGHHLPYTIHKPEEAVLPDPEKKESLLLRLWKQHPTVYISLVVALILALVFIVLWFELRPEHGSRSTPVVGMPVPPPSTTVTTSNNTGIPPSSSTTTIVPPPPTIAPTIAPTTFLPTIAKTIPPIDDSNADSALPIANEDNTLPTVSFDITVPVVNETSSSTPDPVPISTPGNAPNVDFVGTTLLLGRNRDDKFGSQVLFSPDGTYLVVRSESLTEPIQAYTLLDDENGSWAAELPSIPFAGDSVKREVVGIASASVGGEDGTPWAVAAVSSDLQAEVYQLDSVDDIQEWIPRGQVLMAEAFGKKLSSALSIALSSETASTLAVGTRDAAGTSASVLVYQYDTFSQTWSDPDAIDPKEFWDAERRSVRPEEGTVLGLEVALSGDGSTLAVSEWDIGTPEAIVQVFFWAEPFSKWIPRGNPLEFSHGPVSIALSQNGDRMAAVADHPGKGSVYDWDDAAGVWKATGGNSENGFLPGGSAVAMSSNGKRIFIGDSTLSKSSVYDYQDDYQFFHSSSEWSAWLPAVSLWGPDNSGFGASVAMEATGSNLSVGASSYSLGDRDNIGQVTVYG